MFLAVPNSHTRMQRLKACHYREGQGGTIIQMARSFGHSFLEGIHMVAVICTYEKAIIRRDTHIHKVFAGARLTIGCAVKMEKKYPHTATIFCSHLFFDYA